jgi:oxygen-independent coproporphyrinogen-3 oxidase
LFAAAPPVQPADDIVDDMLDRSLCTLTQAGFEQYEVSGYSRGGMRCAHNLNYWTFGDYLGIGAGAHGKITDPQRQVIARTQRMREPRRYLAEEPDSLSRKPIAARDLPFEFAMNGFRLVEGFDDETFESRTGLRIEVLERALDRLISRGLVQRLPGRWAATPKGFRFLNDILVELLPQSSPASVA